MSAQYQENYSGVTDPVAEDTNFKPIPDDQLIDARDVVASEPAQASENETTPQAENFRAIREELRYKKEENDELRKKLDDNQAYFQKQIEELRSSLPQQSRPEPKEKRYFEGMEKDYVASVGEIESAFEKHERSIREQMDELSVMQKYPDYHDVLQNDFMSLVKDKPYLAQMIQSSPNKALAAYELGLMARNTRSQMNTQPVQTMTGAERAQKIVQNAQKPGNIANVGGSPVLSKADYYAQMSDSEFMKLARQNLDGI